MTLSAENELTIRTWIGDDLEVSYLEDLYANLASWDQVVISALRRKIAVAAAQPASISVPGLSISWGQQLTYLRQTLTDFMNGSGLGLDEESTMGVIVGHLVRPRRR